MNAAWSQLTDQLRAPSHRSSRYNSRDDASASEAESRLANGRWRSNLCGGCSRHFRGSSWYETQFVDIAGSRSAGRSSASTLPAAIGSTTMLQGFPELPSRGNIAEAHAPQASVNDVLLFGLLSDDIKCEVNIRRDAIRLV
jgi:hypothetical protein